MGVGGPTCVNYPLSELAPDLETWYELIVGGGGNGAQILEVPSAPFPHIALSLKGGVHAVLCTCRNGVPTVSPDIFERILGEHLDGHHAYFVPPGRVLSLAPHPLILDTGASVRRNVRLAGKYLHRAPINNTKNRL